MLRSLSISNVVLIDRLDIDFETGFGVLTGETGAGKSILLDSLGLVLGKRAETSMIRKGAEKLSVTAVFDNISDADFQKLLIIGKICHFQFTDKTVFGHHIA